MGPEWVVGGLKRLIEQIEETFGDEREALANPRDLASRAHLLVSHASLMGFQELGQRCRELESAYRNDKDLSGPFGEAKKAASSAQREADQLLTSLRSRQ